MRLLKAFGMPCLQAGGAKVFEQFAFAQSAVELPVRTQTQRAGKHAAVAQSDELIPMLVGAGFWRHVVHRVPLRYVPTLWSIVFPLGMFAVASINLGRVDRLPVVEAIGDVALVVAAAVWLLVFLAMLRSMARVLRGG